MKIDPAAVAFFQPDGLSAFKARLFQRIGQGIKVLGGAYVVGDFELLDRKVRKGRVRQSFAHCLNGDQDRADAVFHHRASPNRNDA